MGAHDEPVYPNKGISPRDQDTSIYVRLRNGLVVGPRPVKQWPRWAPWPWGESDWDITEFWRATP